MLPLHQQKSQTFKLKIESCEVSSYLILKPKKEQSLIY